MFRTITPLALAVAFGMASMLPAQQEDPAQQPPTEPEARQPGEALPQDQDDEGRQTVRRVSPDEPGFQMQSDVKEMAKMLAICNKAEIEIAELATEKTQTPEVRQFAQRMIDEHTAFLEKLKQFAPHEEQADTAAAQDNPQATTSEAAVALDEQDNEHDKMKQVQKRAAAYKLSLTKQILNQHEGQDFDMGFLGQQIMAHIDMLAVLHAVKDEGNAEFKDLVKEGLETAEDHLTEARRLAKTFEDRERGAGSPVQSGIDRTPAETP